MKAAFPRWLFLPIILLALVPANSKPVRAQCGDEEMVSVIVLQNVDLPDPLPDEWLVERVHLAPLGPVTNPTDPEISLAINATNGTSCPQESQGTVGDFRLYWGCAWDFITASIVDLRTGDLPFSGWVHWAGLGAMIVPTSSTDSITFLPGPSPADAPSGLSTIPNTLWEFPEGPAEAVDILRESDLFHAYSQCGDYTVVGYTYTPRVGYPEPDVREAARLVLIVRGRLGPPWGPVLVDPTSWGRIKGDYR